MGYASVGTDLGGSIRIPAAMTGVVGLKPTYGLISDDGDVFGLCSRLEHVGPITRTVTDAAIMLHVLQEGGPRDTRFSSARDPGFLETEWQRGLRVGWVSNGGPSGAESDVLTCVESAARVLSDLGVIVEEVTLPTFSEELWYQIVLLDEWEAYDARTADEREYLGFIKARLRRNRQRMVDQVLKEITEVRDKYRELFERFDLLALPTTPIAAKPFTIQRVRLNGQERDVLDLFIVNTWIFNVTGHPAISLPCGFNSEGLPVGLQLAGKHFQEGLLLSVAAGFERAVGGFQLPRPSLDRVR
jgi:aspartyl-tRNA(Asn)/glutamyl-tRNA(Gln) amidotransferase subunit A